MTWKLKYFAEVTVGPTTHGRLRLIGKGTNTAFITAFWQCCFQIDALSAVPRKPKIIFLLLGTSFSFLRNQWLDSFSPRWSPVWVPKRKISVTILDPIHAILFSAFFGLFRGWGRPTTPTPTSRNLFRENVDSESFEKLFFRYRKIVVFLNSGLDWN